jgi:branched-chain amino acid transport system substrate-binding protein
MGPYGAALRFCASMLIVAGVLSLSHLGCRPTRPIQSPAELSPTGATAGRQVQTGLHLARSCQREGWAARRPVELVYYDDQGTPANAPGIYAADGRRQVDLADRPLRTNVIAAALPAIIQSSA